MRLALAAALLLPAAAFFREAATARVLAADAGFAVTPHGEVRVDRDEGPVLVYPMGVAPDIGVRVRVRNTGRFAATVTYPADLTDGYLTDGDPPVRKVRVPARGTAWLEFRLSTLGCPVERVEKNVSTTHDSVEVTVWRPGSGARRQHLALPMGLRVPSFRLGPCDPPRSAP